ncbi:glutamyl-tRNA amidotransferase [Mycoplasma sp. 1654_15]|uniref:glutamyl-tRNA amidotransferase n=1 Tax=Mycoplasma sp. 1654_15 TaxID=2725994 RepID=UPI001449F04C|nr:glutamyl-tRNA amidotransferase [Mycoplasma sp. 1654_15]QJB71024.1 glutamyl-tRNA amidotransferase [Mycoplasma sp. 1654_15]
MEKEKIIELAKLLYFEPTQKVINLLLDEEKKILNGLKQIDKLNLENVQPLDRVDETLEDLSFLRKDNLVLSEEKMKENQAILFKNSVHIKENKIVIKKVIND